MNRLRLFLFVILAITCTVSFLGCFGSSSGGTVENPTGPTLMTGTIPTITQSFDVPITSGLATKTLTFISPFEQKTVVGSNVSGTTSATGSEILGIFDANDNLIYLSLNNLTSSVQPTGSIRAAVGKANFSASSNADTMILLCPVFLGADNQTKLSALQEIKSLPKYSELVAINQGIVDKGESTFDFTMHPESYQKGQELISSYFATKTTTPSTTPRPIYLTMSQNSDLVTFKNKSFIYYEATADKSVFNNFWNPPVISSVDSIFQWSSYLQGDFSQTEETTAQLDANKLPAKVTVTKSTTFNTIKCIFLVVDVVTDFNATGKMKKNLARVKAVFDGLSKLKDFAQNLASQPNPTSKVSYVVAFLEAGWETVWDLVKEEIDNVGDEAAKKLITVVGKKVIGGWVSTGYTMLNNVAPFLLDLANAPSTVQFDLTQAGTTPNTTLAAPSGVTAVEGDGKVTISWNNVDGADTYNIYWGTSPGVTKYSNQLLNKKSPYVHTGPSGGGFSEGSVRTFTISQPPDANIRAALTNGTMYYYAVTASNSVNESNLSTVVSAQPRSGQAQYGHGDVIGNFNSVAIYSNGTIDYNDTTKYPDHRIEYNQVNNATSGLKWECVEFVNRYYLTQYQTDLYKLAHPQGNEVFNANAFFQNASLLKLTSYANGGVEPPKVGDILVSEGSTGNVGHVAIVREVTTDAVYVAQQNWTNVDPTKAERMPLTRSGNTISPFDADSNNKYPVKGWLRKPIGNLDVVLARKLESGDDLIHGFTYAYGSLWGTTRTYPARILRFNPETLDYTRIILPNGYDDAESIIACGGYLWATTYTYPTHLIRIDPVSMAWDEPVVFRSGEHNLGGSLEYAFGYLWAGGEGKLARIDLNGMTYSLFSYTGIANQFHALTSGGGYLWGAVPRDNTILRINPGNPAVATPLKMTSLSVSDDISYAGNSLYVGTEVSPPYRLIKISQDLTYKEATLPSGCYGVFSVGDQIWATLIGVPGNIVRFDQNLNLLGNQLLPAGYDSANELTRLAISNSAIYITSWMSPAGLIKYGPMGAVRENSNSQIVGKIFLSSFPAQ